MSIVLAQLTQAVLIANIRGKLFLSQKGIGRLVRIVHANIAILVTC